MQEASAAEAVPALKQAPTRLAPEKEAAASSGGGGGAEVQGDMLKPSVVNTPWVGAPRALPRRLSVRIYCFRV